MTPKEKAKQLVKRYSCLHHGIEEDLLEKVVISDYAIESALIAVDEFLYLQPFTTGKDLIDGAISDYIIRIFNYWQEVKQEIENL